MAQEFYKHRLRQVTFLFGIVLFLGLQIAMISAASQSDFEEVLKPLQTIYDLVKYTATVIASLVMLFAGILYITSGSDPGKREKAKNMIMYVVVGLIVIWAAPFVVDIVLGN